MAQRFTQGPSADLTSLVSSNASATVYPSDDAVLAQLQARFRADQPYTRLSGSALVAVNPMRMLASLNEASAEDYKVKTYAAARWWDQQQQGQGEGAKGSSPDDVLPPHPYEFAARVYHSMRRTQRSQAILYS